MSPALALLHAYAAHDDDSDDESDDDDLLSMDVDVDEREDEQEDVQEEDNEYDEFGRPLGVCNGDGTRAGGGRLWPCVAPLLDSTPRSSRASL